MKHILLVVAMTAVAGCGGGSSGYTNDNHPWPTCWESSLCNRR